jgi:hypothetical protein
VIEIAISKGPNRVDISLLSPENGNRPSSQNVEFCSYLEFWTMDRVHDPSDSECHFILSAAQIISSAPFSQIPSFTLRPCSMAKIMNHMHTIDIRVCWGQTSERRWTTQDSGPWCYNNSLGLISSQLFLECNAGSLRSSSAKNSKTREAHQGNGKQFVRFGFWNFNCGGQSEELFISRRLILKLTLKQ